MDQSKKRDAGDNPLYKLSDVTVEAVGLVRQGVNRKPFYFIKSEGGTEMPKEDQIQDFSDVLTELEKSEEVNETLLQKLTESGQNLLKFATGLFEKTKEEPEPEEEDPGEGGGEGPQETFNLETYTEALTQQVREQVTAEVTEKFTERIAEAEKVANEERRLRRFSEFCDTVETFAALALPDAEEGKDPRDQFAQDLMEIHDKCGTEVYDRLLGVLKASDKQISEGELFEQYSSAHKVDTAGKHPFEAKIEQIRLEKFAELPREEGFVKAMDIAQSEHPELAGQYARVH